MYVNQNHTDWDDHLPFAVFATKIHQNETTKFSPFELLYGRLTQLPIDSALHSNPSLHLIDLESCHHQVKRHFTQALTVIQSQIEQAQHRYKLAYDQHACS